MTEPTLNNLHPNKYSQEFHYYPSAVKLDKCVSNKTNYFKSKRVQHDSDQQWITIDFNVIVKNAMYIKKITLGIFLHVVAKMENI